MISQSSKKISKNHRYTRSITKGLNEIQQNWQPNSWKLLVAEQQPTYENQEDQVQLILDEISLLSPLVKFDELINLRSDLMKVSKGREFIVQLGDCAETFSECSEVSVNRKLQFFQDVGVLFKNVTNKTAVMIGRVCGQFSKPRSNQYEKQGLHVYRGDLINGIEEKDRTPDPKRLLIGVMLQKEGIKVLRSFNENQKLSKQKIWISHECLHLGYESSLVRSTENEKYYNSSAHFLWLGERTRAIDQAHVNFVQGIYNPIGVKVSSKITESDFLQLNKVLNPQNLHNRLIIITRIGSQMIEKFLPQLVRWKQDHKLNFLWMCDPMHGNTITVGQTKTRLISDIRKELTIFFVILHLARERTSGIHLESTPLDVIECIEGEQINQLTGPYLSACDPRLNLNQTFQLITFVGELYVKYCRQ